MAGETLTLTIRGDSDSARRALREIEEGLNRMGRTSQRTSTGVSRDNQRVQRSQQQTTRTTRDLDRNSRTLGRTLAQAAKWAAGAAAAYIGIAEAKQAVTATTDLAKATMTLTKNLGLSAKTASQFSAVASTFGADSKTLGMAFGTLGRQITAARQGSEESADTFKRLGISMQDLERSSPEKMLFAVTDGLGELGKGFERTATMRALFGRGAQSLSVMLRGGSDSLRDQLETAEELGASFSKLGLHDMEDVIAAQRRMKLGQLGLQIAFTRAVAPAIEGVTDKLAEFSAILNDPKLSADEKLDRIADEFSQMFTDLVRESTKRAPQVAGAFVKGFLEAPVWAQLVTGGLLFARFGGLPTLFGKQGSKSGSAFGKNFALGLTGALLAVELGKQIKQIVEGHDLQAGDREDFSTFLGDLGLVTKGFVDKNKVRVATQFGSLIFNAETQKVVAAKGKQLQGLIGKTAAEASARLDGMARAPQARRDLNTLAKLVDSRMGRIAGVTKKDLGQVREALKKNPEQGRAVLARTYDRIVAKIRNAMDDGRISTERGMRKIEELTAAKLELFGITGVGGSIAEAAKAIAGKVQANKKGPKRQRGGTAAKVPGTGSGDKVPVQALVEPGEGLFVLNRNAMGALEALNSAVPRFQKGGVAMPRWESDYPVGQVAAGALNLTASAAERFLAKAKQVSEKKKAAAAGGGFPTGGPAGSWAEALAKASGSGIVKVGHALQAFGYEVGEHPAFGGVHPVHVSGSAHYAGRAIDVNHDARGNELSALDLISKKLRKLPHSQIIWRNHDLDTGAFIANHMNHLHFAMQRGGLLLPRMQSGGVVSTVGQILLRNGLDAEAAAGILGNAYQESTWNTGAQGMGGGGLWGFTASPISLADLQAFAQRKGKPWTSAAVQTRFMLNHLSGGLKSRLNRASSLSDTTALFMNEWERPGIPNLARRIEGARRAYPTIKRLARRGTDSAPKITQSMPGSVGKGAGKTKKKAKAGKGAGNSAYDEALASYQQLIALMTEATGLYNENRRLSLRTIPAIQDFAAQNGLSLPGPYSGVPQLGFGDPGPFGAWNGPTGPQVITGENMSFTHRHKIELSTDAKGRHKARVKQTITTADKQLGRQARRKAKAPGRG